ncbi:MAG: hypothetical protein ACYTFZ_07060 [Planctomycetota bacterium]|jgi:hypothetical protein
MQVALHGLFAERLSRRFGDKLPARALVDGAAAPNRDTKWPAPHHLNRRAAAIIAKFAKTARTDYMAQQYHNAAFRLGLAMHYALDNLVPYADGSREHAQCEGRFSQIDHDIHYLEDVEVDLGDGRLAERCVRQLARLAAARPLNFQERLSGAHVSFLQLAAAITEDAEPLKIVEKLAEAFVEFALQMEAELKDHRELVQAASRGDLRRSWDWEDPAGGLTNIGRRARQVVGACEALASRGETPSRRKQRTASVCLWRFRHILRARLEDLLGERGMRHLRGRCKALGDQYIRAVAAAKKRANHWNWFDIRWHFWEEKRVVAPEYILGQAAQAQQRALQLEEDEFRRKCAAQVLATLNGTTENHSSA